MNNKINLKDTTKFTRDWEFTNVPTTETTKRHMELIAKSKGLTIGNYLREVIDKEFEHIEDNYEFPEFCKKHKKFVYGICICEERCKCGIKW